VQLLRQVSLSLRLGECLALLGPNGAGKSSLLRVIAGLLPYYAGSIKVGSHEVSTLSAARLASAVSLLPQRLTHLPRFSVREFIALSGNARTTQVESLTAHLATRFLPDLSAGELQRVLLAGALAQGAQILMLDEPTSNLDPVGRAQVQELLSTLKHQADVAVLLVTHDSALATRCCDRLMLLKDGGCHWSGSPTDPALLAALSEVYAAPFLQVTLPPTAGASPDQAGCGTQVIVPA
jgi:iron complex transport system ATP-binding protein